MKCENCFTILHNLYLRKSGSKINTEYFICRKCDIIYKIKLIKKEVLEMGGD